MICPRCLTAQPDAVECSKCGIIVAKFRAAEPIAAAKPSAAPLATAPAPPPAPGRVAVPPVQAARIASAPKRVQLSAADRSALYKQLARLVRSAVPLPEAFELIGEVLGGAARTQARAMAAAIAGGKSLAAAAAEAPGLFDAVDVALLRAAESVGQLAEIAERLAERHQATAELAADLRGNLGYPAFVVASSCLLTPLPVAFSQSVGAYLFEVAVNFAMLFAGVAVVVVGWRALTSGARWGRVLTAVGRVPVLGSLVIHRRFAYWFDVLGRCLTAGLPLPAAVELAAIATGEPEVARLAPKIAQRLQLESLAAGLALLPGLAYRDRARIAAAERSGDTPAVCTELATEARQRLHAGLRMASVGLRIALSAAIAIGIAWQLIGQFKQLTGDPLSMIPGQEGQDLRRELQKAMPQLEHLQK